MAAAITPSPRGTHERAGVGGLGVHSVNEWRDETRRRRRACKQRQHNEHRLEDREGYVRGVEEKLAYGHQGQCAEREAVRRADTRSERRTPR